jgi:LacI family transcriptional regulator
LTHNGVPFVCIIGARDLPGVSCVDVSFIESGYLAVKHLAEKGYKNIAYLTANKPEDSVYAERERLEGSRRAAEEFGVTVTLPDHFAALATEEGLQEAVEKLLSAGSFDSIVATSHVCHTVLKTAAQKGISVPEALGVISLDNELYAPYLYPSLTTVDEPLEDIAKRAMHILDEKMRGSTVCEKIELTPLLSHRESTRAGV